MKKRFFIALLSALLILSLAVPAFAGDFDGLEGVIILTPGGGDDTSDSSYPDSDGLVLTINGCTMEQETDTYCRIILEAGLMNWETSSIDLTDAVSSTLTYEDTYTFDGKIDFGGASQINMLEELTGTITFTVPNVVALAGKDDVVIEMKVLGETYEEDVDLAAASAAIRDEVTAPFDFNSRTSDELELQLGSAYIVDYYNGEQDEKYKWILQDIFLINWSDETVPVEDALYVLLTYMDKYGFEAQIDLPQAQLNSLESVSGKLAFHVPVIVTTAEDDAIGLQIKLKDEEWNSDFKMSETQFLEPYDQLCMLWTEPNELWGLPADHKDELRELNGHLYLHLLNFDEYYYWTSAKKECESLMGHLVTLSSEEENQLIAEMTDGYSTWIGGFLQAGSWQWVDGSEFAYTNWADGEPNETGDYMQMYWDGTWDDTYDENSMASIIVEWDF